MRVALMTYYRNGSYGAALQAYALQQFLKEQTYHPVMIRYVKQWPPPLTFWQFVRSRSLSSVYHKILSLALRRITDKFADQHIDETPERFPSKEDLTKLELFGAYVCGSDQIWNPWTFDEQRAFDDCYFLSFVPDGGRKISYAASFGRAELPEAYAVLIKPLLERMDAISVRESSGVSLIKEMGLRATQVLDPSFLLDKDSFLHIAKLKANPCNGVVVFILGSERSLFLPVCKKLSDMSGMHCNMIFPNLPEVWKTWVNPCYPSVAEWLGMFSQAPFVLTDSFHGTVFSIIFNKPFIVLLRAGGREGRNSRLINLLDVLGLEHRIVDRYDADEIETIYQTEIDWDMVNRKLDAEKKKSKDFLINALKEAVLNDAN